MGTPGSTENLIRSEKAHDLIFVIPEVVIGNPVSIDLKSGSPIEALGDDNLLSGGLERIRTEKEAFLRLLNAHDWYYQYSDDPRAHANGQASIGRIQALAAADPVLQQLLDDYRTNGNSPLPKEAA